MKKSIFGKIGAAAVVLTLVTSSLVGGTFAKFATTASGTATATVAKWGVTFKKDETHAFDQEPIVLEGTGKDNVLLPGDKGSFKVLIDGSDAEVGFSYSISLTHKTVDGEALPDGAVKFYATEDRNTAVTEITGEMGYGTKDAETVKKEVTVYWALPASTNVDEVKGNEEDTKLAGEKGSYTIDMSAVQYTPTVE